jgi:cytoskeletal protein CcmA (bactofilin family)
MPREWLQFTYAPSLISEGTRMKGDLSFVSNAQVHGIIEGNVHQTGLESLQVGPTGWIHGSIDSKGPVLVEGRIDGDVTSETSIRLLPTATVSGCIKAPIVRVHPGALLQGEVEMPHSKIRPLHARKHAA